MKPFNRERFLFYLLAGIFIWQAILFTGGVVGCFRSGGLQACPELGSRFENTVNVMVATTLALLGAGAVVSSVNQSSRDESPLHAATMRNAVDIVRLVDAAVQLGVD